MKTVFSSYKPRGSTSSSVPFLASRWLRLFATTFATALVIACGGGSGGGADSGAPVAQQPPTASDVAAITAAQIANYTDAQMVALGTNIKYLSDAALIAIPTVGGTGRPVGLIASITAAQIAALSPAQVRLIAAAGPGGTIGTSQIAYLNLGAWAEIGKSPLQIAAITPAEMGTLFDSAILAIGANIKYLSDAALIAMPAGGGTGRPVGLFGSITAAQIAAFSPMQISLLATTHDDHGISFLNSGAFASLNASQIAVLTARQRSFLTPSQHTVCGC